MRKLNRAEYGTYTQFIESRGREPSEITIGETIELAYDMRRWFHGHFIEYPTLKLALGILATKSEVLRNEC